MRLLGHLVNVADTAQLNVFGGYSVHIVYLVAEPNQPERTFREQTDTFDMPSDGNEFGFDVPERLTLNLESPFALFVTNRDQVEVFAKKYDWTETLRDQRAQKPLRVPIEGVEAEAAGTPVSVHGHLAFTGHPAQTTGFGGFNVRASYLAQAGPDATFVPKSSSITLDDDNAFTIALPDRERLKDQPVTVEAKYPDGHTGTTADFSLDQLRQPIVLALDPPQTMVLTNDDRVAAVQAEKVKGKVVDAQGVVQIRNRQVILWAKAAAGLAKPILVTTTDNAGNFSGERSKEQFEALMATVAGTRSRTLDQAVPIDLVGRTEDEGHPGRVPPFIYIVVDLDAADTADDDCGCHDGTAPRLPDQEDLVTNSSAYSQDIGPNCVNFTVPNRTLEEFTFTTVVRTSEPEIKGTTLSDLDVRDMRTRPIKELASVPTDVAKAKTTITTALQSVDKVKSTAIAKYAINDIVKDRVALSPYLSDLFKTVAGRAALTAANSVDWDGTPTFYQATTVAHGHILYYKQIWKADGYSLGDLTYSLPLAPGQKKQVVIFDWDRTEYGRRDEASHEDEALDSYLGHNRDILDITHGSFAEQLKGGSQSKTSGSAGGFGAGAGALLGPVFVGVAGGFSASSGSASSSAWQDSSRDVSATGLNQLRDMVQQGASAVRNQRSTVVQTARQNERFKVETEVVANHNHCHAITVQYFEVLRHYAIEQKLTQVQECLFIPLLMSEFDEPKVARWMDLLRPALRDPNDRTVFRLAFGGISFRNKPLSAGFEAIERRVHNYEGADFPATTYAAEQVVDLSGELTITLTLNRPKDKDDVPNDDPIDPLLWLNYSFFTGWTAPFIFNNYFAKRAQQERDRLFESEIAPRIAEGFVDTLQFFAIDKLGNAYTLDLDATLVSHYQRDVPLYVSVRPTAAQLPVTREQIVKIVMATAYDITDSANSRIIVRGATFRYRTAHFDGVLYRSDAVNNDLKSQTIAGVMTIPTDNVVLFTPLSTEELRNPKEEDKEAAKKLLRHLNANIELYHKAIWSNMDPDRRYMLLDGFVAPHAGGKSVASVVENRVIGVAGNSLIMPVAPGYKLDPSYEYEPELDAQGQPRHDERGNIIYKQTDLFQHYAPLTPLQPFRVSVPTRGVFAEAVMGACNSCEKKDETRFWRWEESPNPDEPTPINPVQTNPPQRTEPGNLQAAPFPAPMISIQNAPAAPEPGATLAGALGLLGKSDVFNDITGLEQTQKNALQAMLSNQESAKHYADKAAELATLAANQRGGNSTVESIKKSMDDGTLDRERGKKLIEDVYRAQISGKPSADQPINTANNSELAKAAADAVKQGRDVKAVQNHPDGTQTSVDQKAGSPSVSTPALLLELQKPDPSAPDKWIPVPAGEGPGFAKFDHAFDATGNLVADYPDQDSGRFRIALFDADPLAAGSRDVKWQATQDAAGSQPVDPLADTTITLTSDISKAGLFVSKPLVLVHEKEDVPPSISNGLGAVAHPGDKNYRARRAGMFATIAIEDGGRRHTFPCLAPAQRTNLPIHVFLLKQGTTLSIPHAELAERISEVQRIYEPHGIFLNAHAYVFNAAQTAKYQPAPISVGTGITYACSEIDVTGVFNQALLSDADIDKLGVDLAPNAGGPVIRLFFFADFAVNNTTPAPSSFRVALAMNRSFVNSKPLSAGDKQKLMFSLMCAGRVHGTATQHPYAVAHEFGHLMMDKLDVLTKAGLPIPTGPDQHHFNAPTTAGFPLNQNLMRPTAANALGINQPKRIWDVKDKDNYNQLADLKSNVQKLQVP